MVVSDAPSRNTLPPMIHHDYLLRLIEEFARAISRIRDLRAGEQPAEARHALEQQFERLLGADRESILRLSATEMLARLLRSGTTQELQARTLFLATLLRESAELARGEGRHDLAIDGHLKALRLLLSTTDVSFLDDSPGYAPTVDGLLAALARSEVPGDLRAQVMQYHERQGRFAEAENDLFDLLDQSPPGPELFDFGSAFYRRVLALSDATLLQGHLPRAEAMEGYTEFRRRAAA